VPEPPVSATAKDARVVFRRPTFASPLEPITAP
jgi:hypothetical protein